MNIDQPLRLAVGSHRAGSGKGCAMNVLSWENGDTTITDLPACADPFLAIVVQRVNDSICTHRDGDLLCPTCSMLVLDLAHRTFGTGDVGLSDLNRRRVWVRIAATEARSVLHLAGKWMPKALAAILAAEAWSDEPTAASAAYAADAASAADAAYAASAADAAYAAAAYAADAYVGAYAAYAAAYVGAYVGASPLERAHQIIDQFETLTGHTPAPTPAEVTADAIRKMLAPA